jgi:hypothetical protein|tara:strand:+ start:259 stop:579 length:321 start_codon:yes stop_codon:yes gene_type:complete
MVIEEVFEKLKKHDRKLTKKKFCNDYLGKSESYYYVMKHLGKEASNDALLKCYVGLKGAANAMAELGSTNSLYQTNKLLADMLLEQIENKVVEEIWRREQYDIATF